jgi:hypothetical protein
MNLVFVFLVMKLGSLAGQVIDGSTGEPLSLASVVLKPSGYATATNDAGRFLLRNIPGGSYSLSVSHLGYIAATIRTRIVAGSTIDLKRIELAVAPISVKGLEVHGKRPVAEPASREGLTTQEVKSVPGAERDLFRAVQALPGVTVQSDFLGWLFVRGGSSDENLYVWDGIELDNPYHFFGLASIFSNDILSRVELLSGGFGSAFGDRLSSVLTITSRDGNRDSPATRLSADPTELAGVFEFPLTRKSSFILSGRRCFLGYLLPKLVHDNQFFLLPSYTDGQERISIWLKPNLKLDINGLQNHERIDLKAEVENYSARVDWQSGGSVVGTNLSWMVNPTLLSQTILSYSRSQTDFTYTVNTNVVWSQKIRSSRWSGAANWQWALGKQSGLKWGTAVSRGSYYFNSFMPEDIFDWVENQRSLYSDTSYYRWGSFVHLNHRLSSRISAAIGLRSDYLLITRDWEISPRIGLSLLVTDKAEIRLLWGHYTQYPNMEYLNIYGKSQPRAALAKHYILEWEYRFAEDLSGKVTFYDKELSGLPLAEGGWWTNDGHGYARGVECTLKRDWSGRFYGWLSYAYALSRRTGRYDTILALSDADQPHIFNAVFSCRLLWDFHFSTRLRITSGVPYTPVIGSSYDTYWVPVLGDRNSARQPPYSRFDVRLEKSLRFGSVQGTVYLSIINLLNRYNLQGYLYNDDYTKQMPYYMLPRIPLVGLELAF